jgi:hypothetical protein
VGIGVGLFNLHHQGLDEAFGGRHRMILIHELMHGRVDGVGLVVVEGDEVEDEVFEGGLFGAQQVSLGPVHSWP